MTTIPPHLGGHGNRTHMDEGAIEYLHGKCGIRSMVDIGCGPGGMVEVAKALEIQYIGVDGDPAVEGSSIWTHDFCDGPWDWYHGRDDLAWSVEFLEHVAEEYQENYMALFRRCRVAFTTACPPTEPGGHHHVNVKPAEYWHDVFWAHGFIMSERLTEGVREVSTMGRPKFANRLWVYVNIRTRETN